MYFCEWLTHYRTTGNFVRWNFILFVLPVCQNKFISVQKSRMNDVYVERARIRNENFDSWNFCPPVQDENITSLQLPAIRYSFNRTWCSEKIFTNIVATHFLTTLHFVDQRYTYCRPVRLRHDTNTGKARRHIIEKSSDVHTIYAVMLSYCGVWLI